MAERWRGLSRLIAIAPMPALFFKAKFNQATTLLIGLNPTILVGLAAVAANRLSQKAACNFQSFGYGSWV